jgi:hypothetical protein
VTDGFFPAGPNPEDHIAAELLWSVRAQLPEREVIASEAVPFEHAFSIQNDFRFTGWGTRPPLSHARVLYRDALREPAELRDVWVPRVLVSPEELGRADGIEDFDLARRHGPSARPHRVAEWVHFFEPYERDRILLELDPGRAAISITGVYRNLFEDVLGVEHRWVRVWSVLTFARNLLWERAACRDLHLSEVHPWPPPWRAKP